MTAIENVRNFVAGIAGWFEEDDSDETTIRYFTRQHGSVYDEKPGVPDLWLAREIGRAVEKEFPNVRHSIETVDEWTHLNLEINPSSDTAEKT